MTCALKELVNGPLLPQSMMIISQLTLLFDDALILVFDLCQEAVDHQNPIGHGVKQLGNRSRMGGGFVVEGAGACTVILSAKPPHATPYWEGFKVRSSLLSREPGYGWRRSSMHGRLQGWCCRGSDNPGKPRQHTFRLFGPNTPVTISCKEPVLFEI